MSGVGGLGFEAMSSKGYSIDCPSKSSKLENWQLPQGNEGLKEAMEPLGGRIDDPNVLASLLRRCCNSKAMSEGKLLHALAESGLDRGTFLGNLLVQMYGKCGRVEDASMAFERISEKNVFSWTLMFRAYAQNGRLQDARYVFDKMPVRDVVAWTAMLTAYSKKGHVEDAKILFDKMPQKDVVACNAMLAAYGQHDRSMEALQVYRVMQQEGFRPNETTFVSILDVCAGLGALAEGKRIHATSIYSGLDLEATVGTALVNMYGKCGSLSEARSILDAMPRKNLVACTAMITAYAKHEHSKEALRMFVIMDLEGLRPDDVAFVSALHACTTLSAFATGKIIRDSIIDCGFDSAANVGNGLITFYGKSGCLDEARSIFNKMQRRNIVSWNAMLGAYAHNGHVEETLELYLLMSQEGVEPDEITFVIILSACSHGGLLHEGCYHFSSIIGEYDQQAVEDHYMCILDLLGRAGQLEEAENLINSMPFKPNGTGWTTLLGACKMHGDTKRGERAGQSVISTDDGDAGPYMLLSSIYAAKKYPSLV